MHEPARYPGYDVLAKRDTPSWDAQTRRAIDARLAVEDEPGFLDARAWAVLKALCERILPQTGNRTRASLAAYVDRKLLDDRRDGWRPAALPAQREAWTRGLNALDAEANAAHGQGFPELASADQDALIAAMQKGDLSASAWDGMPCEVFFNNRVVADIGRAYYAHPSAWSEIGFGGPASPRGYVRMDFDKRDPWEASEARPGREAKAKTENSRVGR